MKWYDSVDSDLPYSYLYDGEPGKASTLVELMKDRGNGTWGVLSRSPLGFLFDPNRKYDTLGGAKLEVQLKVQNWADKISNRNNWPEWQ